MNTRPALCIVYSTAQQRQPAQQFAERFGYPLFDARQQDYALQLCFNSGHIELFDADLNTAIHVDFVHGALAHREKFGGGRGQAIARAVGLNKPASKRREMTVLDATAGLARDAWVLATLGCRVTLVEQSPVLFMLIHDGITRALTGNARSCVGNFTNLVNAGSVLYMQHMDTDTRPDVIYIDPMYPERKKSALVKKDMQILHKLIGPPQDETGLLQTAMQYAGQRVVVKRPLQAEPVGNIPPDASIRSKKTRYDLYLTGKG